MSKMASWPAVRLLPLFLSAWCLGAGTEPPAPNVNSGKSLERPVAVGSDKVTPFEYRPTDAALWAQTQELMKQGNYMEILRLGSQQLLITDNGTSEYFEGKLLAAIGFHGLGLKVAASYLFIQLAQEQLGSKIGEAALYYLSELDQDFVSDHSAIEDLLVANEFGPLNPYIQSFVSYYKGMHSLRFNLKWSDAEFARVMPNSYWAYKKAYLGALSEIARGNGAKGRLALEKLSSDNNVPARLQSQAQLQVARLNFEDGNFKQSLLLYKSVDNLGVRERGRIMLEQAWAQYYQKEYAQALGILKALEAPYFSSSMTFERFVLTMIIYKELCYYDAVAKTAKDFRRAFATSLRDIKKRHRLVDNPILAKMGLMHGRLRERADYINVLREERNSFKQLDYREFSYYSKILSYYDSRDQELQSTLDNELGLIVRGIAVELLDVEEQVQFLEYTAQMDSLRILRSGEKYRSYQADKIDYFGFDRIYWPVTSEFWWDELNHYKVLASSRCGDQKSTLDENIEDDL